uniref:Transcription repressor n=1 Tax=Rhizophora mucronata TaxID=61149 RepID=A0A2P2NPN3_RHIMU
MNDSKMRESVPVVKNSQNPYEDFKRSMLEMILERQMFEDKDLEELLQCFLSLNKKQYHGVIVEAFSEIWEILFQDSPVKKLASVTFGDFKA